MSGSVSPNCGVRPIRQETLKRIRETKEPRVVGVGHGHIIEGHVGRAEETVGDFHREVLPQGIVHAHSDLIRTGPPVEKDG